MTTYLERYLQGEYEQVWSELIGLGDRIRQESIFPDAYAVAQEIMQRVRLNVECLIPRLEAIGYHFGASWDRNYVGALVPPEPDVTERILEFERECAPIPLVLRACCEIIGRIDFRGQPPLGWAGYHDELVIEGSFALECLNDWEGNYLEIGLFSDTEQKRGGRGVGPVCMSVPNMGIDGPLFIDDFRYPFGESLVSYLRTSILKRAGFPCFPCPEWVLSEGEEEYRGQITHLKELIHDLIPF